MWPQWKSLWLYFPTSKAEEFSSEVLCKLTFEGKCWSRHCLCVLLCLFVSSNALHVAADCHEAHCLARPVAPRAPTSYPEDGENRFGFAGELWRLHWLGKSSATMATTLTLPVSRWGKKTEESVERSLCFVSAVTFFYHRDQSCLAHKAHAP